MRPQKPIILVMPALLIQELNKHLIEKPPEFKYEIIYFYYGVHYIISKQLIKKDNE